MELAAGCACTRSCSSGNVLAGHARVVRISLLLLVPDRMDPHQRADYRRRLFRDGKQVGDSAADGVHYLRAPIGWVNVVRVAREKPVMSIEVHDTVLQLPVYGLVQLLNDSCAC